MTFVEVAWGHARLGPAPPTAQTGWACHGAHPAPPVRLFALRVLTRPAPIVRCDQVQWELLGISMAGWNAIISLGGALGVALLLGKRR